MKKDFGKKPWIYPQPVLMVATYDENGNPDIMNAAWGGVGDDTQIFICMGSNHQTTENLELKKAFTVSIATEEYLKACDYLGIVSAKDTKDKVAKSGLHVHKSNYVDAPVIDELPLCLECEVISYDKKNCHLFGEIVNTSVDESILTDGKVDPKKLKPLVFDICNSKYYGLSEEKANAFSAGKELK